MTAPEEFYVDVPGSTANLGPGFDCLGLAMRIANRFHVRLAEEDSIAFDGPEGAALRENPGNLFHESADFVFRRLGVDRPPIAVTCTARVPNARGLGSSSTAVVGGLAAGNVLAGEPFNRSALLDLAGEIEGHPDNVAPALLGGLTAAIMGSGNRVIFARHIPHETVGFVALIPDYEVPTVEARRVLPQSVPLADAIANLSRLPLLVQAIVQGRFHSLRELTADRLHEPHRMGLYRKFDELRAAGFESGAAAVTLSGAGPTMLAIAPAESAADIVDGWTRAMEDLGVGGRVRPLEPDSAGMRVTILRG